MYIQRLAGQQGFLLQLTSLCVIAQRKEVFLYGHGQPSYVNPNERWPSKKY